MAPILSTWIANNSEPHYRRATSVALGFIATNAVSYYYSVTSDILTVVCPFLHREESLVPGAFRHQRRPDSAAQRSWISPCKPKTSLSSLHDALLPTYFSSAIIAVIAVVNAIYMTHKNRSKQARRDEILRPYVSEKAPDGGHVAWVELGDQHPDFEYAL